MLNFIGQNYGIQEMEDPCYDMGKMATEIANVLKELNKTKESEMSETYEF